MARSDRELKAAYKDAVAKLHRDQTQAGGDKALQKARATVAGLRAEARDGRRR